MNEGEAQVCGINVQMRADDLGRIPVQAAIPVELMAEVSTHGFWKWGTTANFDIRVVNLDAGSYLRMTPKILFANS